MQFKYVCQLLSLRCGGVLLLCPCLPVFGMLAVPSVCWGIGAVLVHGC